MKYVNVPADIRELQAKIDAIYDQYPGAAKLNFMVDPGSMKRGHQVWIGRYTQAQFRLIEKYNLNAADVFCSLANNKERRVISVD